MAQRTTLADEAARAVQMSLLECSVGGGLARPRLYRRDVIKRGHAVIGQR